MGRIAKKNLADLAIFGGNPLFSHPLHVGRPNIGNKNYFYGMVEDILNRRWLTNGGKYVRLFEEKISEFLGVKHCITTCNGTMALQLATRALGLTGEVIVPSFTFIATPNSLLWQGIKPIFCDIDNSYNIDPLKLESLISEKTSGILGVHLWGRPCNIELLTELAHKYGIKLLFDSSHAFGCSYQGKMLGSFGEIEIFSFHATKFINALEGGAVVTNDDNLANKVRLMKNFGFTNYDTTQLLGINGKMNEISAAMGIANLALIDKFISINKRNYNNYVRNLKDISGISIIKYNTNEKCNYQYVVIEIDEEDVGISRDNILKILHAEGMLARKYFYPGCHLMEPYKTLYPSARAHLKNTEKLAEKVLCLPTGTAIGDKEIVLICDFIHFLIKKSRHISKKLKQI